MNKEVIYFLMNQVTLIMGCKKKIIVIFFLFFSINSYCEILYDKENVIITDIDIDIYKKLYENNYELEIDNNNALKDLVLINNLIIHIEKNNKQFLDRIDSEISMQYGDSALDDINFRDFLRFSKVKNEFIINYFNTKLTTEEIIEVFEKLDSLELPVSLNDCMIIEKVIDFKNNKNFIEILLKNLKDNSKNFKIIINDLDYKICIDENNFRSLERLIIKYIETQTSEDFKYFVYGKTKN